MNEVTLHPASLIFPAMSVSELKSLAEDIKAHGLIEPIGLHQGMILDGRNRYSACRIAGVEARYRNVDLGDLFPVQYVIAQNLERRNLTKSQLAAVAGLAAEHLRLEHWQLKRQGKPSPIQLGDSLRELIGKALNISAKLVQDAINVRKENPELFQQVWAGKIQLWDAVSKVASPPQRNAERIGNYQKRKMIEILSHVRGACRGLAEIDLSLVPMDQVDRKAWIGVISRTIQELRIFSQRLKKANHEDSEIESREA